MPGGGITGDASVKWFIDMDDARIGSTRVDSLQGRAGRGLRHSGIEHETVPDGEFKISIEIPNDRARFADELEEALRQTRATGQTIELNIAIRQRGTEAETEASPYQIRIEWESVTNPRNVQR